MHRPQDHKELFNLRHAQARNVVERVFGVLKKRFQIFNTPPEYPFKTQAHLVHALAVVHNLIRIYDPHDVPSFHEDETENGADSATGELAGSVSAAERTQASEMRDHIANEMWKSYQNILHRRRG